MLGPALISFTGNGDRLRMLVLLAHLKCRQTKLGVSFTWKGAWEWDQMTGTGRVKLTQDGRLNGVIKIKYGDESTFIAERAKHIAVNHPDFLPGHLDKIPVVLGDPDQIRRSKRFPNARLFTRWFDAISGGKFIVVVVVSDSSPKTRHWIITGYVARKITEGETEWKKS